MNYPTLILLVVLVANFWVVIGFGISVLMTRNHSTHGGSVSEAVFWSLGWPIALPLVLILRRRKAKLSLKAR